MENITIEGTKFRQRLKETQSVDASLSDYLKASLATDKADKLCRGWKYLEQNITNTLGTILWMDEYWALVYNDQKVSFIERVTDTKLTDEERKQLDSFVYVWNTIRREENEKERAEKLKAQLEAKGYKEILYNAKEWADKKVKCVLDVTKIGLLGSFDEKAEVEGTLKWHEQRRTLFLLPKRSRSRGYNINANVFVLEA